MSREVHVRFCESRGVGFPPATHLVVLVTGQKEQAPALRDEVAAVLAPMGLRLSPEKTRVVHIDDGFDFLGFHIRRMQKRGTRIGTSTPRLLGQGDRRDQGPDPDHDPQENDPAPQPRLLDGGTTWVGCCVAGRTTSRHGVSNQPSPTRSTPTRGERSHVLAAEEAPDRILARAPRRRFLGLAHSTWRRADGSVAPRQPSTVTPPRYRYRGATGSRARGHHQPPLRHSRQQPGVESPLR